MNREIEEKLKACFLKEDVEWRIQDAGVKDGKVWARVLAYIDNRAIVNRLDEVFGIAGWQNHITEISEGSFLCGISFKYQGEWITKWDGADATDIEPVKGAISGAMKRAGAILGIGRYLYDLEAGYATISDKGKNYQGRGTKKDGTEKYPAFKWDAPELPKWALPTSTNTFDKLRDHEDELDIEQSIMDCKSLEELKIIWSTLDKEHQKKFTDIKDATKKRLTGE